MAGGFDDVRQLCEAAVADRVVPGLVLLCAAGGRTLFHEAFGYRQLTPRRLRAAPDTVYDVASLTKAAITSVLAMQLVDRGTLSLDEPVAAARPRFPGPGQGKGHDSPPAGARIGATRPSPVLELDGGRRLGALGDLAHGGARTARVCDRARSRSTPTWASSCSAGCSSAPPGLRLDVQAARGIFQPLGLGSTTFVNLADSEARARLLSNRSVAATQLCPERRRVVLGEVDDLNAYAMGGIAGHAGLFSDATDLGLLAGALCAAWKSPTGSNVVSRETIRTFWSPAGVPGSTWRLGWDGPAAEGSQAGARLSRAAVGHLGFTGCSLWIDPERELWIVMLSNRVHPEVPSATDHRFRELRPRLHDAVLEAIGVL